MRRLICILAAVSLLGGASASQSTRTATIDAIVTDRDGRLIPDLGAADFRVVTADGKVIPVTSVRAVTIPPGDRGKATAMAEMPLDATNTHAADARLFVLIVEPLFFRAAGQGAWQFVDELVSEMGADDQIALFVAGHPGRQQPPTNDTTVLARAFGAIPETRLATDPGGMTALIRDELPKIYQAFMRTRWVQRAIVLISPGGLGPDGMRDYKNWNAWAQRANAPMHGVDPLGAQPSGAPQFAMRDQPLLRLAAEETGGLRFLNRPTLRGIAGQVLAASSQFYELQIDVPPGIKTDQSFYTTARSHPRSKTRARLRVRIPEPIELDAHVTTELKTALSSPLPMDEIPLAFGLESAIGATGAMVKFLGTGAASTDVVELPAGPLTIAFAAVTDAGRIQDMGARRLNPDEGRIEGCCMTVRQDIVIPKNAVSVRVAVYQHPTGKVGAVFLPIERR